MQKLHNMQNKHEQQELHELLALYRLHVMLVNMEIIAFANQKGGVGKTALAFNTGAILAERGYRVLLADLDPQASLTAIFGIDAAGRSIAEVIGGAVAGSLTLAGALVNVGERLDLAPSDVRLVPVVMELVNRRSRETVIREALASVAGRYDVAILDCPPSLGLMTINALAAVTAGGGIIIPARPEAPDLRGVQLYLDSIRRVQGAINPDAHALGILPTFYDERLLHHRAAIERVQHAGLVALVDLAVGRSIRVAESMATGKPLHKYEPDNPQTAAFLKIADWIAETCLQNAKPTKR